MIIHCLSCGKSISSRGHGCPYCFAEVTELTFELNGIEDNTRPRERMLDRVLALVHK